MSIARYVSRRPGPHLASTLDGTTEQSRPHGSTLYMEYTREISRRL